MDYKSFSNYLFRLVHIWAVHINKEEYYFFLKMIYDRITKYVRITSTGEISYYPKYNISIKRIRTPEEYEKNTWEDSDDKNDFDLYEYEVKHDDDHNIDEKNYKRPVVDYIIAPHIINYNETIEYESDIFMERDFEIVKPILLSDEEIVIYGYPTQFILNYIKNNLNMLSESKEMKKSAIKISVNKEIENIDKSVLNHNFVYTFEHNRY